MARRTPAAPAGKSPEPWFVYESFACDIVVERTPVRKPRANPAQVPRPRRRGVGRSCDNPAFAASFPSDALPHPRASPRIPCRRTHA